jgi:hypothetical protein
MATDVLNPQSEAWRSQTAAPSLPEVYRSLHVPRAPGNLRKMLAFAGPGFLVAVGYTDPGNWATDLAGGSRYNLAFRHHAVKFDGCSTSELGHQIGRRDRPRSCPGLP